MKIRIKVISIFLITLIVGLSGCGNKSAYRDAMALYENGEYKEAAQKFDALEDYEDSEKMAKLSKYREGEELLKNGSYAQALDIFEELDDFENSQTYAEECRHNCMLQKYKDVFEALNGMACYYNYDEHNGKSGTTLGELSFSKESAYVRIAKFDGNGMHISNCGTLDIEIDDRYIYVGSEIDGYKIEYSLTDGKIVFRSKGYYTIDEVYEKLQGEWSYEHYWISMNNGVLTLYSRAYLEIWSYTIEFGDIKGIVAAEGKGRHAAEHHWTIENGEPIPLWWCHEFERDN